MTAALLVVSIAGLSLTGIFVWNALKRSAESPTGAAAGTTETINAAMLDKTLDALKKKADSPLVGGDVRNPFATPAAPAPTPPPAQ